MASNLFGKWKSTSLLNSEDAPTSNLYLTMWQNHRNSLHKALQHICRNFLIVPFVCHTLNDYYVKRPINNTPSKRFEWVKCGKYWEENPIMCEKLMRTKKNLARETISFTVERIHLFLRLPSFLCFISLPAFFFLCAPFFHCRRIREEKNSVIYENAKCSFAGAIINCCAVNYSLKLREGNWKQKTSCSLFHQP